MSNLYKYFTGTVDVAVEAVCKAKGIPKERMPPKAKEVIDRKMKAAKQYLDEVLDELVEAIKLLIPCDGEGEVVDLHEIVYDEELRNYN